MVKIFKYMQSIKTYKHTYIIKKHQSGERLQFRHREFKVNAKTLDDLAVGHINLCIIKDNLKKVFWSLWFLKKKNLEVQENL